MYRAKNLSGWVGDRNGKCSFRSDRDLRRMRTCLCIRSFRHNSGNYGAKGAVILRHHSSHHSRFNRYRPLVAGAHARLTIALVQDCHGLPIAGHNHWDLTPNDRKRCTRDAYAARPTMEICWVTRERIGGKYGCTCTARSANIPFGAEARNISFPTACQIILLGSVKCLQCCVQCCYRYAFLRSQVTSWLQIRQPRTMRRLW